ncbi:hypothetical protein ACJIZ3_021424 [Penstemon smallii]|uniref:G protein gamma domain-containing protein n=1 Tax=Penstemon smallii TaxID=265156 RepID=A0ABD3SLE5_9LAMI
MGKSSLPSLPPPRPKSPPEYPDLYGKRRELAKVQMLEREINFLEEELKFVEVLQPASRSSKEVVDFVTRNADPFIPTTKKIRRSKRFWKWLCGVSCFNISSIFCCCLCRLKGAKCCECSICNCSNPCSNCRMPKCRCSSCWSSQCFSMSTCSWNCCIPKCPSCLNCCSLRSCKFYPKCPEVNICSCYCNKNFCCYSCYFCC